MLTATARLKDGGLQPCGRVSLDRLRALERDGLRGRSLVHALTTDDWGAPPLFLELTGLDENGQPLRVVIPYE